MATLLGVFIIPVLYVVIEKFIDLFSRKSAPVATTAEIPALEREVED
jgi:hypothetical protein